MSGTEFYPPVTSLLGGVVFSEITGTLLIVFPHIIVEFKKKAESVRKSCVFLHIGKLISLFQAGL